MWLQAKIILLTIVALIFLPGPALAGEKGKMVSLLVDYADLKQRVLEIREARKSGYSSEPKDVLELSTDIQKATVEVRNSQKIQIRPQTEDKNQAIIVNMLYAYNAMLQLMQAESDRYFLSSNVGLSLAERYEEIWKLVDPSIPKMNLP